MKQKISSENLKRRRHLECESASGREIVLDGVDWIRLELAQDNIQWQACLYIIVYLEIL
jgi:hypothetical protein